MLAILPTEYDLSSAAGELAGWASAAAGLGLFVFVALMVPSLISRAFRQMVTKGDPGDYDLASSPDSPGWHSVETEGLDSVMGVQVPQTGEHRWYDSNGIPTYYDGSALGGEPTYSNYPREANS